MDSSRRVAVLLFDHSAWSRVHSDRLDGERRAQMMAWMDQCEIATCLPFLLEAGYSARSADDHDTLMAGFGRLPNIPITPQIEGRAKAAQYELAKIGHHRLSPADLIIAACAEDAEAGVLHYDADYDIIAERTTLEFDSEWLAPPGTL
jgi:predicted nucleic acid-binding protein